ncbi:hypothetical protein PAALTS15_01892 [Paenibacillus alvei TS-15]|uniref:Uncharacterized protein n=1 Tax=Paenibacillus alvei TS-15 TaxID=1117108 RepID=S9SWD4_PAEAL|nr:hypothetical protein [Paenibacillus alvei]EPY08964.1 hypothetical protein PAALTS15_01892 [Paenibacillus alvei TS-15]
MLDNDQELAHFLVDAKQRTYAAADNNTSVQPILPSSVQLEYPMETAYIGIFTLAKGDRRVYELRYSGGMIR